MMTQDSLRFYKSHAVYPNFGGVVLDREEGRKIAECLGDGKAAILQNHGLITVYAPYSRYTLFRGCTTDIYAQVGETIDAAAFWFLSLDKTCKPFFFFFFFFFFFHFPSYPQTFRRDLVHVNLTLNQAMLNCSLTPPRAVVGTRGR
jgi:hypothetical protein